MSDIFLSYASADREWAKMLAEVLAEQGWSVWWDRVIPPGKQFDEVIEEALDGAKCVVVLWSHASVASTWVKTEAAEAMRRKVLIPALMEDVRIPLEFRRLQAADLAGWQGDRSDPRLIPFYQSIGAEVKRPGQADGAPVVPPVERPKRIEVPPPPRPNPAPPVARPQLQRKWKRAPLIGTVVAAVVALLGAGLYFERAKNIEMEREARARAAYEQAERDRERTVREEAASQEAARADAQRRANDERRAKQQADRAAREEAARAASQRKADEERRTRQQAGSGTQQAVPQSGVVNLQWRDHALGFNGSLTWSPSNAVLRAAIVDLKTGIRIGNYAVPARVSQQGPVEYLVSAEFAIPGDSTTPGPHTHTSRLLLRAQQDGSVRVVQNCPQPGQCY